MTTQGMRIQFHYDDDEIITYDSSSVGQPNPRRQQPYQTHQRQGGQNVPQAPLPAAPRPAGGAQPGVPGQTPVPAATMPAGGAFHIVQPFVTPPPRVGGTFKGVPWTGGSYINPLSSPHTIMALRPQDFKSQLKVDKICSEGLQPNQHLDVEARKGSPVTLTSWVRHVKEYMEERGLDTVFRIYNYKVNKEFIC